MQSHQRREAHIPTPQPPNPDAPKSKRAPARQVIRLSARDSRAVIEALLHPMPAGPAPRKAAERYHALVRDEGESP